MNKFKVGDKVRIIDRGLVFDLYNDMAKQMNLTDFCNSFVPENFEVGVVVAMEPSNDYQLIYGVHLHHRKKTIIIGWDAIEHIVTLPDELFEI